MMNLKIYLFTILVLFVLLPAEAGKANDCYHPYGDIEFCNVDWNTISVATQVGNNDIWSALYLYCFDIGE